MDGYLITAPLSFMVFLGVLFVTQEWLNYDWYARKREPKESDSGDIKEAYEFMSVSTIMLKINCVLAAFVVLINMAAQLKREALHRPEPAFFKFVAKS